MGHHLYETSTRIPAAGSNYLAVVSNLSHQVADENAFACSSIPYKIFIITIKSTISLKNIKNSEVL
jgi:hypothetical protein